MSIYQILLKNIYFVMELNFKFSFKHEVWWLFMGVDNLGIELRNPRQHSLSKFLFLFSYKLLVYTLHIYLTMKFLGQIPIYARAQDLKHLLDLKKAGATDAILENTEVLSIFFSFHFVGQGFG